LFFLNLFVINSFAISLVPPASWEKITPNQQGVLLQYVSPKREHNFVPNLIVAKESLEVDWEKLPTPIAVSEYVEGIQRRILPMFKVVERREEKKGSTLGVIMVGTYAFGESDLAAYQYVFRKRMKFLQLCLHVFVMTSTSFALFLIKD
jgi:hypothetical protein